jgi:hypothetical protein
MKSPKRVSEREIARTILKHLRSHGVLCFRHEPHTYNHQLGMHISNPYDMKGVADIICVLPEGKVAFVEVKTKTGKQSADQVLFKKRVESLGALYIVARSVEDVDNLT